MLLNSFSHRKRVRAAVLVCMAIATMAIADSVFAYEPPSLNELRDTLARRNAMIAADPPRGDVLVLDGAPEAGGTAADLFEVVQLLDELIQSDDFSQAEQRHLLWAGDAVNDAFESYGLSPDIGVVFKHLSEAARSLQAAAPP